jgi:hypothetical protein
VRTDAQQFRDRHGGDLEQKEGEHCDASAVDVREPHPVCEPRREREQERPGSEKQQQ